MINAIFIIAVLVIICCVIFCINHQQKHREEAGISMYRKEGNIVTQG